MKPDPGMDTKVMIVRLRRHPPERRLNALPRAIRQAHFLQPPLAPRLTHCLGVSHFANSAQSQHSGHGLAFLTHERCRALSKIPVVAAPKATLSSRELECLRWVGAGKTDWEIGKIVSLSPTTVKSHVDQARKKLGASTRPQAVARLVFSGLL
jgi:DNA-binding CsgD family transcriptional regulator